MNNRPTWKTVKGTLIHRCALAPAGKWTSVRQATRIRRGDPEPAFLVDARWMAQQLTTALNDEVAETAWALIDSGGPSWSADYNKYLELDPDDRVMAIEGLETIAFTAATELLDMAGQDGWDSMLSEAVAPLAFLVAGPGRARSQARNRIDLLVRRHLDHPLIVDLKTGEDPPDPATVAAQTAQVADTYGRDVAAKVCKPVDVRVLSMSFTGETTGVTRSPYGQPGAR